VSQSKLSVFDVTDCANLGACKMNEYYSKLQSSRLHASKRQMRWIVDDVSEFQQKCLFGIRKPPFYPLNYGNSDNCDPFDSLCSLRTSF